MFYWVPTSPFDTLKNAKLLFNFSIVIIFLSFWVCYYKGIILKFSISWLLFFLNTIATDYLLLQLLDAPEIMLLS